MSSKEAKNLMKSFRIRSGYKLKDLAKIVGVAYASMQGYESKPYSIPVAVFGKLSEIYGSDFVDVFLEKKLYYKYN